MNQKMNTSHCRKRIGRKIQTKQFETLEISIECEDEFTWSTIKERDESLKKLTLLAIRDFEETFNQVCNVFGFEEKRVFAKNSGAIAPRTSESNQVDLNISDDSLALSAFDKLTNNEQ